MKIINNIPFFKSNQTDSSQLLVKIVNHSDRVIVFSTTLCGYNNYKSPIGGLTALFAFGCRVKLTKISNNESKLSSHFYC